MLEKNILAGGYQWYVVARSRSTLSPFSPRNKSVPSALTFLYIKFEKTKIQQKTKNNPFIDHAEGGKNNLPLRLLFPVATSVRRRRSRQSG